MKAEKDSVLVLGSSSWIGHYLLAELQKVLPSKKILAGYSSNRPSFLSAEIDPVQISSKNPTELQSLEFQSVVHLARGEEEEDFRFLQMLIHKANQCGGRVLYLQFNEMNEDHRSLANPPTICCFPALRIFGPVKDSPDPTFYFD